jgi:hypothetical protein
MSPTATTIQFGDGLTVVDQGSGVIRVDAGTAPPAALSYGTTLPASPVNGQEAILVDSTTNPMYQWRFRYNAGSTSAYKWEFVGGAPALILQGAAIDTGTASAWIESVSFTVPRPGEYFAQHQGGNPQFADQAVSFFTGVSVNGAPPARVIYGSPPTGTGTYWIAGPTANRLTLASGQRISMIIRTGAIAASWVYGDGWALPYRVS